MKILCILIPGILSYLLVINRNKKIVKGPGTVVWAYGLGICFSLLISLAGKGAVKADCTEILEVLAYFSVSAGIPLLLFSNNITDLHVVPKEIKKAFLLLVIAVTLVTLALYCVYTKNIENGKVLSGMALAIYTGGTPNLNAVAYTFHLGNSALLAANLSDVMIGAVFYLFLLVIARMLAKKDKGAPEKSTATNLARTRSSRRGAVASLLSAFALTIGSAGLGALTWLAAGKADGRLTDFVVPVMMIGTTSGGILLARNEKISSVAENDDLGQYFITLFSFSIASLNNPEVIKNISNGIFATFLTITVASFFVHLLLCRIFRINLRAMVVTSTAGIYGPAFIPGICRALGADDLIPAGLVMGSLGYVIGTFLGCGLILLL